MRCGLNLRRPNFISSWVPKIAMHLTRITTAQLHWQIYGALSVYALFNLEYLVASDFHGINLK